MNSYYVLLIRTWSTYIKTTDAPRFRAPKVAEGPPPQDFPDN
jgi:hypothetical protein